MESPKPIVGIVPLWDEKLDSLWMLPGYFNGIENAGGIPLMLPLTSDPAVISQIAQKVDGVLFTGGHDIHPSLYGREMLEVCEQTCVKRDEMERLLFTEALGYNKPILGICRGIQLFNVLLGGTLYQDITSQTISMLTHSQQPPYDLPAHEIDIMQETPLHKLLGTDRLSVNSYHHQGIRTLASQLKIMAKATDGLVEAVYIPEKTFAWAVQWHPEFALDLIENRALFKAFVRACEGNDEISAPYFTKNESKGTVRVIDKTMSCLDGISNDKPLLLRFLDLLIKMEVDAIEISQQMKELLSPLPDYPSYLISGQTGASPRVCEMDDAMYMDDAMCGDYQKTFSQLIQTYGDNIEFCPGNTFHCATALAVEWVASGAGNNVVTTFGGYSNYAATEEVLVALRLKGLRKKNRTYNFLPEMLNLFENITNKKIHPDKPVMGERIYHVESGIHVDGILKQPVCYEPFPPELVGRVRKIILGKQSGTASIRVKLSELESKFPVLNITRAQEDEHFILEQVKAKAIEKNGIVTDLELAEIVARHS